MSESTQQVMRLLDDVLSRIEPLAADSSAGAGPLPDAIDRQRTAAPRGTAVERLRRSEAVERFRRELESESLTVSAVAGFLEWLTQAIGFFRTGRGA